MKLEKNTKFPYKTLKKFLGLLSNVYLLIITTVMFLIDKVNSIRMQKLFCILLNCITLLETDE